MSMIDPITGLRTPIQYTPIGAAQQEVGSLGGMMARAGTPAFSPAPLAAPQPLRSLGSLMTGPAGPQLPRINAAPFARPISGLASQVPTGVGKEAMTAANALRGGQAAGSAAAGGARGLAAQVGGFRGAAQAARSTLPGVLGKAGLAGSLARGAAPMVTGMAGSAIFGEGDEGFATQAGRGFLTGAGWGLPAAGVVGAIPGVNLVGVPLIAAAAGITGTLGAALDVLDAGKWFDGLPSFLGGGGGGGEEEAKVTPDDVLANILSTAQLDPDTNAQILDGYAIQMELAGTIEDEAQRAQAEAQALMLAGQQALAALEGRDAAQSQATNTLALQAQAQDIFGPLANDIEQSGELYAQQMAGIRDLLPESHRAISDATVARELTSSQKLANAYRAQAAITPAVEQLTQYQQDFDNYSAQLFAQSLAQQAAGQTGVMGPSATDVQALLSQIG